MKSNTYHPDDKPKIASGIQDAFGTHGYNGGRMPRPKTCHVTHTMVHDGMLSATKANGFIFGGDASSRNDADPGTNPLGGAPAGKRLTPVVAAFGQRSRTSSHDPETGAALLDSATKDPHHPGFGK